MNTRYIKHFISAFVMCIIWGSCSKMEDTYDEFVAGGEIYYPGKAESLTIYPGRERVALSWLLTSDPKITKTTVYWNNRRDSAVIPVQRSTGVDTIRQMIAPLAEGTYSFEVYTYDSRGNRSVKVEAIGSVFGNNYGISLVNRTIESTRMQSAKSDTAVVFWYSASPQLIGVDLRYKNSLGDSVFRYIQPDSLKTRLTKFIPGESFIYRSLYKPEKNAIDTFYTGYESVQVK